MASIYDKERLDKQILEHATKVIASMGDHLTAENRGCKLLTKELVKIINEYIGLWSSDDWVKDRGTGMYLNAGMVSQITILLLLCHYDEIYSWFYDIIMNRKFPNSTAGSYGVWTAWVLDVFLPDITGSEFTQFLKEQVKMHKEDLINFALTSEDREIYQIFKKIAEWIAR